MHLAPRDVYRGVFDLYTKSRHAAAVRTLDFNKLKAFSLKFSVGPGLVSDFPDRVVAVAPYPSSCKGDD